MNRAYLALKFLGPIAARFEDATKDPMRTQEKVLLDYISRNKNTEYGKKYNFSKIESIEDYRRLVPVTDYTGISDYAYRMARGEKNVLTAEDPVFFGRTSGTTGKPKLIPVTKYSRSKKAELMALWSYYISRDHPDVTKGKIFAIIDPEVKTLTESGLPAGPENGHAYENLPYIIKSICAVPYEVFEIEDYNTRYYSILRIAIGCNVTTVATLNPSALIILCEKIKEWQYRIIGDIEKGTLDESLKMDLRIRAAIEKKLKPDPARADELRKIISEKGELLPKYFWKDLTLIECWKGGTVKLYLKGLPHYFGDLPIRDFGCLSTETRNSIPITDEGAGGVLALETNFYEFIPKEDVHKKDRRVLLCDQLERGRDYLLIVTTAGGLYRYDTDDVVRVDNFFNRTPVIEFIQKAQNAISITGEKVYESHINEAVNNAAGELKLNVKFFSSCVQMEDDPPRYIFLVEFGGALSRDVKKAFLKRVEEELRRCNLEYEDTRERLELGSPILKVVRTGGFEKYRFKKVSEGAHEAQFKVPELVADPGFQKNFDIEEEILFD